MNPLRSPASAPSGFARLVNLALGISATLGFAGACGLVPLLVPTRWLLAPWYTSRSMAGIPPLAVAAAKIGLNLWLPASVLMALFWLTGLHRKVAAPRSHRASAALALAWIASMALTFAPHTIGEGESAAALTMMMGLALTPLYLVLVVVATIAACTEIAALARFDNPAPARLPGALLAWAIVPPVLSLVPLMLTPANPFAQAAANDAWTAAACRDVGVRWMARPSAQVRSIAYDWDPTRLKSQPEGRIETDDSGRIGMLGGSGRPRSAEFGKRVDFDFTESRRDPMKSGLAAIHPDAAYYHFPKSGAYSGVDALSADVLAWYDFDTPAPAFPNAIRYRLTLTDRRSSAVLGVQTYVIDMSNQRACGANVDHAISRDAFVYDAIHR